LVLAQAGQRVVLISADLRKPTLAKYFGLSEEQGLATFLMKEDDPWSYVQDPGIPNLRIIPSGSATGNPAELLTSPLLSDYVGALESSADLILIDSPPVLAVADASILAGVAGGTLLVVDAGSSRRSAALHATQELRRGGGEVIGIVLNDLDMTTSPYYYGSYGYTSTYLQDPSGNGVSEAADGSKADAAQKSPRRSGR
jgi:capsular exopolysaccharide synthesis family protein